MLVCSIDYISGHYLFSVHMLQHLLMIMIAPPFWLLGLPDNLLDGIGLPGPVKIFYNVDFYSGEPGDNMGCQI